MGFSFSLIFTSSRKPGLGNDRIIRSCGGVFQADSARIVKNYQKIVEKEQEHKKKLAKTESFAMVE